MQFSAVLPTTTVAQDIVGYVRQNGGYYPAWYCGVASDPRARLFQDHNVSEHAGGPWIFRDCGSDSAARTIEQYFLTRGCQGGSGGGDRTSRFFYAYKITLLTRE